MSVRVIADIGSKLSALRARVEKQHAITPELLSGASIRCSESDAIVVTADLRVVENIVALKEMFGRLTHLRKRIFLVDQKARLLAVERAIRGSGATLGSEGILILIAK